MLTVETVVPCAGIENDRSSGLPCAQRQEETHVQNGRWSHKAEDQSLQTVKDSEPAVALGAENATRSGLLCIEKLAPNV